MNKYQIALQGCDDCKYKSICKYVDVMAKLNEELKEIKTVIKEPFSINLNCRYYEKEVSIPRAMQEISNGLL